MQVWDLLVIAVGVAMDAFAVSICKGLATKRNYIKAGLACGIWFGLFQAIMPLIGYGVGRLIRDYIGKVLPSAETTIEGIMPFVACGLLCFLGVKMIVEAIKELGEIKKAREEGICDCCADEKNASLGFKVMFLFAIATSVDALLVGLTFVAEGVPFWGSWANIWVAISFIGLVTFLFSFVGAALGARIGGFFRGKAEIFGGAVLIVMGVKTVVEYLWENYGASLVDWLENIFHIST